MYTAFIGFNNRKGQPGIIGFSLVTGEKRTYDITAEKDALLLDISNLYLEDIEITKVDGSFIEVISIKWHLPFIV